MDIGEDEIEQTRKSRQKNTTINNGSLATRLTDSVDTGYAAASSILDQGYMRSNPNYSSIEVSIEDFHIEKVIGRGSFGKVYLVKKKSDGNLFAMKTLKKDMIIRKG